MDKISLKGIVKTQDDYMREMFGETNNNGITELSVFDLEEYKNQPFRPYSQEKLEQLAEDIKENGILSPIIVRKIEPTGNSSLSYQILAGHNRVRAAKIAQIEKVPAIIKTDITDEEAVIIMTTTNLNQRDELLASEKAFAYRMKLEAIKHQGIKSDLTSSQVGTKLRSDEEVAQLSGDSRNQIQRYIRLTELITPLLDMVDNKSLSIMAGYNLSFLSDDNQMLVFNYIKKNQINLSIAEAECLKKYSAIEAITEEVLDKLFGKEENKEYFKKSKESKSINIKIYDDIIIKYFSANTKKEIEVLVNHILEDALAQREL